MVNLSGPKMSVSLFIIIVKLNIFAVFYAVIIDLNVIVYNITNYFLTNYNIELT